MKICKKYPPALGYFNLASCLRPGLAAGVKIPAGDAFFRFSPSPPDAYDRRQEGIDSPAALRYRNPMRIIAPSILSADFSRLGEEIRAVAAAGADWIHIDVMDGRFVPNITIGPAVVSALRKTTALPFDVHLMIADPDRYLDAFLAAGSDWLTVHVEAAVHLHRTITYIKEQGCKAGVSLNPSSPLALIEPVLPDLDLLLVMTVNPGFGGQKFIPTMLAKIAAARKLIDERAPHVLLEVDGGITTTNIDAAAAAGASVFVAGNAVFGGDDYARTIATLKDPGGLGKN
jgi:ribulose-phosphate 3-epimerase